MSAHPPVLTWQHRDDDLVLLVNNTSTVVPAEIAEQLTATHPDWMRDPARDLLITEDLLGREAGQARQKAVQLAEEIATEAIRVTELANEVKRRRWRSRRQLEQQRRQASAALRELTGEHTRVSEHLHRLQHLIVALRGFVLDLDFTDGLLGEASRGWRRLSLRPAYIETYRGEDDFLLADIRGPARATRTAWGAVALDAEDVTHGWRRDEDEPNLDTEPGDLIGPWELGYLPRTGEVYAVRRATYLDDELWLMGEGFRDRDATRAMLNELHRHKREPNSLLLAAETIHAAQLRHVRPPRTEPAPRLPGTQQPNLDGSVGGDTA